ncbi:leptin [Erinaceus europaeus]|uniref:Leptin n=1 Tax=Erinaceus europaeus TaxID=9365 RepID=A0A1S2ZY18_ERIEU|nr:leptin [Erinaceus europaeus]
MHWGPLCQFLWLWPYLSYLEAVPIERIQDDTKTLIKTTILRINSMSHKQPTTFRHRVSGLDFIPELQPEPSFSSMEQTLSIYQQILTNLLSRNGVQVINDLENLRELLHLQSSSKGCPKPQASHSESLGKLEEDLESSLFSMEVVTLGKLREVLQNMLQQLELHPGC